MGITGLEQSGLHAFTNSVIVKLGQTGQPRRELLWVVFDTERMGGDEQHLVEHGMLQCEIEVSSSCQIQTLSGRLPCEGLCEVGGKQIEGLHDYIEQELLFGVVVPVESGGGDAEVTGQTAHGDRLGPTGHIQLTGPCQNVALIHVNVVNRISWTVSTPTLQTW